MSEEPIKYINEQNPLHVLSVQIFQLFKEYRVEWLKENPPDDLIWIFNSDDKTIVSYNINFEIPVAVDESFSDALLNDQHIKDELREKFAEFDKNSGYDGLPKKLVKKLKDLDDKKEKLVASWNEKSHAH